MNFLMIRHGEIPSNVNKVYAGRAPERLTEKGVQQARQVSEKLKGYKVDAIYSSPTQRALQTAQIISEKKSLDLRIEEAFREIEMGPWEGMSEVDVEKRYPDEWNIWNTRPDELEMADRETLDELLGRVLTGVKSIYDKAKYHNVVIVTHVAIIRVLLLWHAHKGLGLYKSIHIPNAEIFEINICAWPGSAALPLN